jgi:hypothetical protein
MAANPSRRRPLSSNVVKQTYLKWPIAHTQARGAPWRVPRSHFGRSVFIAVMRRRVAQGQADQGARMFERSEFTRTPLGPSNAACPKGRRIRLAFSLVTFFWRSKRKLLRCRAHNPTKPRAASARLDFYLRPQLHHSIARQVQKPSRPTRVKVHLRKQLFAPLRHAFTDGGNHDVA